MDEASVLGRPTESGAVLAFVSEPDESSALMLEGPAGIGKTTLWAVGVDAARRSGIAVSSVTVVRAEATLPYAGLHALLDPFGAYVSSLPAAQSNAIESVVFGNEDLGSESTIALPVAVLGLLRRLAEQRPVLLAVDDLQWIDDASAKVLGFVLRRASSRAIRLLATVRVRDEFDVDAQLSEHLTHVPHQSIIVGPLSPDDLRVVIENHTGRRLRAPIVKRIHDAAEGNCFHALELVRALPSEARLLAGEHYELPRDLRFVLRQKIRGRSTACRITLLRAAAAATVPAELFDGVDGTAEALDHDLLRLEGGTFRFVHPLVRAAVYMDATPDHRRQAHAWLAERINDTTERLLHLALAEDAPAAALAADLEDSAATRQSHERMELAALLMSHAWRLTSPAEEDAYVRRGLAAAQAHALGGDFGNSRRILVTMTSVLPAGPPRAGALLLLGELQASLDEATKMIAMALAEAGTEDDQLLARLHGTQAIAMATVGKYSEAEHHARIGLEAAERSGEPLLTVSALVRLGFAHMYLGRRPDLDVVRRASSMFVPSGGLMLNEAPDMLRAVQLLHADRLDESRHLLTGIGEQATRLGDLASRGSTLLWLVPLEIAAGNGERAAQLADEMVTLLADADGAGWRTAGLHIRASVECFHGLWTHARNTAAEGSELALQTSDRSAWLQSEIVAGAAENHLGLHHEASRRLEKVLFALETQGDFNPAEFRLFVPLIESLVRTGQLDMALARLGNLTERAEKLGAPSLLAGGHRLHAEIFAAEGGVHSALARADEAVAAFEQLARPVDLAGALRTQGLILRRLRRKARAKETLERARELLIPTRAEGLLRRIESDIGRGGLRTGPDRRTLSIEDQVARLAAQGNANGQIARILSLSQKTVEAHLTRHYRRHGLRSRHDLIRRYLDDLDPNSR